MIIFRPLFALGPVVALVLGVFLFFVIPMTWDETHPDLPDPQNVWLECVFKNPDDIRSWGASSCSDIASEVAEYGPPIAGDQEEASIISINVCLHVDDDRCHWGFRVEDYFPQCHYHGWYDRWTVERNGEVVHVYEPDDCNSYGSDKYNSNAVRMKYDWGILPGDYVVRWQFFDRSDNERYNAETKFTVVAP